MNKDRILRVINGANRILIASHTSPDPDAVASVLLLGTTLRLNFPDKAAQMALEEEPDGLNFLDGYELIKFGPLATLVNDFQPDLFIMVDVNTYKRCSRRGGAEIEQYIAQNRVKTAMIDHHEPDGKDKTDIYINSGNPAAVQEVYELCFEELSLQKPKGYAQTTMLGLYADTGGFVYSSTRHRQTLKLSAGLTKAGASIEAARNQLNQYSEDQMRVVGELATNITHKADYTYSFLSDEFVRQWVKCGKSLPEMHAARKKFIDGYIRNIDKRQWGFLVSLDPQEDEGVYSVSLRSAGDSKDVSRIANKLDGGGHKPAAGGKVQAKDVQEAIEKVKAAIAESN